MNFKAVFLDDTVFKHSTWRYEMEYCALPSMYMNCIMSMIMTIFYVFIMHTICTVKTICLVSSKWIYPVQLVPVSSHHCNISQGVKISSNTCVTIGNCHDFDTNLPGVRVNRGKFLARLYSHTFVHGLDPESIKGQG